MNKVYIKARAKINLSLEVLDKREDNYHNIKSVFQKINLYDEIFIEKMNTEGLELQTNIESLNNNDNIIYKAYEKLSEKYKSITGVKVTLNKRIPMQAGLAGGSTDCASFIVEINKLFDLEMSKKEMETIGKSLGADVVPCFYNRAVLAEGIGDEITEINTDFKYYVVIIKPQTSCDTKDMYKKIDEKNQTKLIDKTDIIIKALEENNIKSISNNLHNSFEDVMPDKKLMHNIKDELTKNGAIASLMTGSGSCVYGIFENKNIARNAYKVLKEKYETYICTSYNSKNKTYLGK